MVVAVIYGGDSCEKEVSVISGMQAINALKGRHKVVPVYWADGKFFSPSDAGDVKTYLSSKAKRRRVWWLDGCLYRKICGAPVRFAKPDCVLVCTHGGRGEDGSLQGFLDVLGVRYTCADVEGCAVGMDKELSKHVFAAMGLKVAPWRSYVSSDGDDDAVADDAIARLGLPLCVKPCRQGSSIGVSVCRDREQVKEGVAVARSFDDKIIAERAFVDFKEINCACMTVHGEQVVSATERPLPWSSFLSYEEKYLKSGGKLQGGGRECPADLPQALTAQIEDATLKIYRALDARGVIRVDYIVEDGELWVNEVNVVPGSLATYLFAPLGMSAADVLDALIGDAAERRDAKKCKFDSPLLFDYLNASANACKIAGKII